MRSARRNGVNIFYRDVFSFSLQEKVVAADIEEGAAGIVEEAAAEITAVVEAAKAVRAAGIAVAEAVGTAAAGAATE